MTPCGHEDYPCCGCEASGYEPYDPFLEEYERSIGASISLFEDGIFVPDFEVE